MSATAALIRLLGEVALLLWGMHMVHSGVLRVFGAGLRRVLAAGLQSRAGAFMAGLGLTLALQSSTATGLMATSFVGSGLVGLEAALAVMLGANVGTTLIVQLLAFDISLIYPLLLLLGVVAFKSGQGTRLRDSGRILVGLGLMLLSLHLLAETVAPAADEPVVRELLAALTADPFLNLLLAALLAWAAHSSVAIMLPLMSLAGAGLLAPEAALAMVLGANLGSALNPLLAALGGEPERLRLPLGNLATRLLGCAIALPFLPELALWMAWLDPDPARRVADFHTLLNFALAALLILPLPLLARLLQRLLPAAPRPDDPARPLYLDPNAIGVPSVALAHAAREVLRMVDVVRAMLEDLEAVLVSGDRRRLARIGELDDVLDRLHDAIKRYLTLIQEDVLSPAESRRLAEIFAFSLQMEHVGDIIDKNLAQLLAKKIRGRLSFSPAGLAEIKEMHERLLEHLQLSASLLMSRDPEAARRLVAGKESFRDLEQQAMAQHLERLRQGRADTLATTSLHLDLIRDLKRIESHIAATAHPVLQEAGELRASRLVGGASRPVGEG